MFRTSLSRGLVVGALILSLTATIGGSAYAAPLTDEKSDCSTLAQERNEAVHFLHDVWQTFRGDLKDLASEARQLQKEAHKSGTELSVDARAEVASAQRELTGIWVNAHDAIQGKVELGQACKEETETTTTTTTTTSAPAPTDASAPSDSTDNAHTFDTSDLAENYRDIVDQAIVDMQAVVDEATAAVDEMKKAAETADTSDDAQVTKALEEAKTERAKEKDERTKVPNEHSAGKGKDAETQGNGKGNGKGKGK
jgi:hypothetical protein